jgi:signal transduction histidine kinase
VNGPFRRLRTLLPARLRWRLTGVTILLLALALVAVGLIQYVVLRGYLLERSYATVSGQVVTVRESAAVDSGGGRPVLIRDASTAIYDQGGRRMVQHLQSQGPSKWLVDVTPAQVEALVGAASPRRGSDRGPGFVDTWIGRVKRVGHLERTAPWLLNALQSTRVALGGLPANAKLLHTGSGAEILVTVWPLSPSGAPGTYLLVETPIPDVDAMLQAETLIFSMTASAALLAAALLAAWLTSRTLSPLERVTAAANRISAGEYDARTSMAGDGEVAALASAFDEMVDRLQERIRREQESQAGMRRFLADASHELRTPIAAIMGHVEVLQRGAAGNRRDLDESLAAMHLISERMSRLVSDLLMLTRFEQASDQLRAEPVDVRQLLRDAARAARFSAPRHPVALEPPPRMVALGDRDALERILANLIDNAARYCPAGTRIEVGARRGEDGRVELLVSDRGPGVRPEERERIFERLYRGDRSRAARNGQGAGLGLAICRALARGQGGEVEVRDRSGGGSTFVVTMPGEPVCSNI